MGMNIGLQEASFDIWDTKYRLRDSEGNPVDKDLEASRRRVATALAEAEPAEMRASYEKLYYDALEYAIPAGRIYSNAGASDHKRAVSLINCTVSDTIQDSMDSILMKLYESGLTLRAGCGIGYEFSTLRPKGSFVFGAGAVTSGPLSFMDVYDKTCFTISSAGGRRGAQMATFDISHPDVLEFIRAKREDGRLRQFNLSVLVTDEFIHAVKNDLTWVFKWDGKPYGNPIPAKELWDIIMKSTYNFAEPGFLLVDRINHYNNLWFCENLRATNPCVTGDTLVAVAGRGPVPIKQLAEEGVDIPVYGYDFETGKTVVKYGRNPRRTGIGHKVYRVTLDDGSSFKGNAKHKVPLRDGSIVGIEDLVGGESLVPFVLKDDRYGTFVQTTDGYSKDYQLLLNCKYYGTDLDFGTGVGKIHSHHVDGDHFNNDMDNLEAMYHEEHTSHHLTEANYGIVSQGRVQPLKVRKTKHSKTTRRLIGLKTLARFSNNPAFKANHRAAVAEAMQKPETRALLSKVKTKDRQVLSCVCEGCETPFNLTVIVGRTSPQRFCSQSCAAAHNSAIAANTPRTQETLDAISKGSKAFAATRKGRKSKRAAGSASIVQSSLKCGSMMLHLGHKISARTWDSLKYVLHEAGIKPTIGAAWIDNQWDGDWKAFTKECKAYNHKVVSIEYVGREDVYNLTVDDVHNYCIVTKSWKDKGITYWTGVLQKNCGEQPLPPYGACLLGSLNLTKFVLNPFTSAATFDFSKYEEIIKIFTRMLDNVVESNGLPLIQQRHEIESKRRHGMGFLGLGSTLTMLGMTYGSPESVAFTSEVTKCLAMTSFDAGVDLAIEKGEAPILQQEFNSVELQNSPNGRFNTNMRYANETYTGRQLLLQSHYFDAWRSDERGSAILKRIKKHGCRFTHATSLAPTGCCLSSTKIITDAGIKSYQSIMEENGIDWKSIEKTNEKQWLPLKPFTLPSLDNYADSSDKIWYNGYEEIYEIVFEDGSIFECTPIHKLFVRIGKHIVEVEAQYLKGDEDIVSY